MPKILDNPKEKIISAARSELREKGVAAFNIRSVAAKSGVAIGTIYNYASNKDSLMCEVLRDEWVLTVKAIREGVDSINDVASLVSFVFDEFEKYFDVTMKYFIEMVSLNEGKNIFGFRRKDGDCKKEVTDIFRNVLSRFGRNVSQEDCMLAIHILSFGASGKEISKESTVKAASSII